MTTTAQSIIKSVQTELQDDGTRWPATELVDHLNDGQREIASLRPDMFMVTVAQSITGVKHTLPAACVNLVEITRNTNGAPMRKADRTMLDAVEPSWMTKTASTKLAHFCYDLVEPDVFYTYPPAASGASVDTVYSTLPTDVAAPSGILYSTVSGNIACKDTCKNALIHWCLSKAFSKDAEFGGNAALRDFHLAQFKSALAEDAATGQAVAPKE